MIEKCCLQAGSYYRQYTYVISAYVPKDEGSQIAVLFAKEDVAIIV